MKHLYLKFTLFVSLFFAPVVFSGCDFCDCDRVPETYYDLVGIYGQVFSNNGLAQSNRAYKYDSLNISVTSELSYITMKPKNLGGATLLATKPCDCWEKYGAKGSKEKMKSITITSSSDYTNNFLKGKDLAPLMSIWATMWQLDYSNPPITKKTIENFLSENPPPPISVRLDFNSAPTQDKKHIFTIRYELDNGEVYTYITPEITFQ